MQILNAVRTMLRHPVCSAGLALFAIVLGLLASLLHEKILSAWPFPYFSDEEIHKWGDVVHEAAVFWILILLFAIVFALREMVRSTDNEEIRTGFHQQLDRVIYVTEYTPPPEFYSQFERYFKEAVTVADKAIELVRSATVTGINPLTEPVRLVQDFILQLTRLWDITAAAETVSDLVYRSNIMWYLPKDTNLGEEAQSRIYELSKKFYEYEGAAQLFRDVDGFLIVDSEMSTKEKTDGQKDDEIENLLLLCFVDQSRPSKNLLGAPIAAITGEMSYVNDTSEMARFAKKQRVFSRGELTNIDSYYQGDNKGRSIISVPIFAKYDVAEARPPMGVLNIYRDQAGIMGSKGRATQFALIVTPFVNLIRRLMLERQRQQSSI